MEGSRSLAASDVVPHQPELCQHIRVQRLVPVAEAPPAQAGVRVGPAAAQDRMLPIEEISRILWIERVGFKPCTPTHIAIAGRCSRGGAGRRVGLVLGTNSALARQPAEPHAMQGPATHLAGV